MSIKTLLVTTFTLFCVYITHILCIINGVPIDDLNDAPYQVSIRLKSLDGTFGSGFVCSGALINRQNVLTSAQCLHDSTGKLLSPESFTLVFGTVYRTKAPSQHISRNIRKIYLHERLNVTKRVYDLAVLRLDEGIPRNYSQIREVSLRENAVKGNTDCRLAGWGSTVDGGPYSDMLQMVDLKVMGPQNCNNSAIVLGRPLDEDQLCVGAQKKGACHGDLVAPLICEKYNLTGIVTLENGCGAPGRHAVFTSVFSHKQWIESVLKMDNSANLNKTGFVLLVSLLLLNIFK
uniref:CSON013382 protein n=1 Tax=Culicoides sonorensis TaxID=179676 RepID=A0A336M804_CULSO